MADDPLKMITGTGFPQFGSRVGSVTFHEPDGSFGPGYQGGTFDFGHLAKAGGWQPIPGSKHGGMRRGGPGNWEYKYPSREHAQKEHHNLKQQAAKLKRNVEIARYHAQDASRSPFERMQAEDRERSAMRLHRELDHAARHAKKHSK